MSDKKQVITRFAPSPTGDPHIGNIRSALYAWLFARQNKGKFLLRIEDTDRKRRSEGSEQYILDSLEWLGLDYDDEVLHQSTRQEIHQKIAEQLVESGHAYKCFCTPERLEAMRKEQEANKQAPRYDRTCRSHPPLTKGGNEGGSYVIRLKIPEVGETKVDELIRGELIFNHEDLDDFVILKSDGFPTYHLAHVVDDHDSGVTHVIRGDDWIPSLGKHVLIHQGLGWDLPIYAHLPMVLSIDKAKLGKRHGAVGVLELKKLGVLPDALINMMLLLGWHPKDGSEQEIFTRDEMLEQFKLEDIKKSGAVFDYQKLGSINSIYIRNLDNKQLAELAKPFFNDIENEDFFEKALGLEKDRISKLSELPEALKFIFEDLNYEAEILIWKKSDKTTALNRLEKVLGLFQDIEETDWQVEKIESKIKSVIESEDLGMGDTLWPTRVALATQKNSPGPFEIADVLGKEKSLERLKIAIEKLK